MPERSEILLMSDYINLQCNDVKFYKITKSIESKLKDPNVNLPQSFSIKASSRGKELRLSFSNDLDDMILGMGMSGNWIAVYLDTIPNRFPKHTHLFFYGKTLDENLDVCLCMVDVRRFAKYRWIAKDKISDKGPDPVDEFQQFYDNLLAVKKIKDLNTPINELLLSQYLFAGVGNYLRAEILYRLDINPFTPFKKIQQDLPLLIRLCQLVKSCMNESYVLGGGQLKSFVNPFGQSKENFSTWMKCYGKGLSFKDGTGRTFWYNPKYILEKEQYINSLINKIKI